MRSRYSILSAITIAAAIMTTTLASTVGALPATMVIKLSAPTLNDANHEWMKRFAVLIEKNSDGRMKAEIYPASQLGSIPRQIEGAQLGSIQIVLTAAEFLVGVDPRFELLAAPGIFQNDNHVIKTITDPEFANAFLAMGASKGLLGAGLLFNGPAAFAMRAPARTLADFKGKKIRVLASPFQTEQIARLGGTGVSMTLGDVLPALQQGTIDGALASVPVISTLHFQDAARYTTETDQSYVLTVVLLSKKWFDGLPGDLQAITRAVATQVNNEVRPWALDFLLDQRKAWIGKGGELIALSPADKAELMARYRTIGDDIVKSKPQLKPIWDLLVATALRSL
jgi:TRAP-type transport system periplasmic protein